MKRLMIIAVLALVTYGATGCNRQWFTRGSNCNTAAPNCGPDYQAHSPVVGAPEGTVTYPGPGT